MTEVVSSRLEEGLSLLINLTGKMRMLSHRAVMFVLMAENRQDNHDQDRFHAAISEFSDILNLLIYGDESRGIDREVLAEIESANIMSDHRRRVLERFLKETQSVNFERTNMSALANLVDFVSTDLLDELNALNAGIIGQLSKISQSRAEKMNTAKDAIRSSVGRLSDIGHTVRMVAMNAAVEAARANEFGAGFSVIAREIKDLGERAASAAKDLDLRVKSLD